jgi:hypothetical protein
VRDSAIDAGMELAPWAKGVAAQRLNGMAACPRVELKVNGALSMLGAAAAADYFPADSARRERVLPTYKTIRGLLPVNLPLRCPPAGNHRFGDCWAGFSVR